MLTFHKRGGVGDQDADLQLRNGFFVLTHAIICDLLDVYNRRPRTGSSDVNTFCVN